jgi:ribosomal protein L31
MNPEYNDDDLYECERCHTKHTELGSAGDHDVSICEQCHDAYNNYEFNINRDGTFEELPTKTIQSSSSSVLSSSASVSSSSATS